MLLARVVSVRHSAFPCPAFRLPLPFAGRAPGPFPLVLEQVPQEFLAPLRRCLAPGPFQAARDCVGTLAGAMAAVPAEALLLEGGRLGLGAEPVHGSGAMGLAEGVATGNERDCLLVIHRHA